jgi:hypoxanthine phosphoribosyltransferase
MTFTDMIGTICAVLGIAVAVYFGIENRRLQREKIRFTWDDISAGARDLARKIKKAGFAPEIVLTLSFRGAMVAGIIVLEFDSEPLVYTCIAVDIHTALSFPPREHTLIETTKWRLYIPDSLRGHSDKKILIVDDFTMSGDALGAVRRHHHGFGFDHHAVKAATLVCTTGAIDGGKAPEFYWYETPTTRFYFPWGQAR